MNDWAKNSVGKTSMGGEKDMAKQPTIPRSRKKKVIEKECDHLFCFYGNQEPSSQPVAKICEELPQPNFWKELQLPYCPRCGNKL